MYQLNSIGMKKNRDPELIKKVADLAEDCKRLGEDSSALILYALLGALQNGKDHLLAIEVGKITAYHYANHKGRH